MGGRGAYYKKIGKRHKPKNVKENVFFDDKKFGKKVGKHAVDFGLDVKQPESRDKFAEITKEIIDNSDEKRTGNWRGQEGAVTFYIKGNDVVVVNENNEYVTTLKNGITNKRVREGKKK